MGAASDAFRIGDWQTMRFLKRPVVLTMLSVSSPVVVVAALLCVFVAYNGLVAGFVAEYRGISVTIGEQRKVIEISFGQNRPDGNVIDGAFVEFDNVVRIPTKELTPQEATEFFETCGKTPEMLEGNGIVWVSDGLTHFYFDDEFGGVLAAVRTNDDAMSVVLPQGRLSRGDDWSKVKRMLGEPLSTHKIPAAN